MKDKYINVQIPILDDVNGMEIVKTFTEEQLWYVCAIAKAFEELQKENQELKKQFKELKSTNSVLANELTKDTIIKQKYLTTCCGIPIGDIPKLKFKQKEFIEWLENEIQKQKDYGASFGLTIDRDIAEYISEKIDVYKKVLSKYKEIIGVDNE